MYSKEYIYQLIEEELSRSDINSIINNKIDTMLKSNDFKKSVKSIIADTLEELYRAFYQRKSFWQSAIK